MSLAAWTLNTSSGNTNNWVCSAAVRLGRLRMIDRLSYSMEMMKLREKMRKGWEATWLTAMTGFSITGQWTPRGGRSGKESPERDWPGWILTSGCWRGGKVGGGSIAGSSSLLWCLMIKAHVWWGLRWLSFKLSAVTSDVFLLCLVLGSENKWCKRCCRKQNRP